MAKNEICPCYADIDPSHWKEAAGMFPNAKQYTDWREMFDKHEKEIDAVVVTTPDHTHAFASMRAIKAGKGCYTEKPLTWSIPEARKLAEATKEMKVATQMGNMAHNSEQNCLTIEFIQAGAIGDITEIHTTTNRPVWPQGPGALKAKGGAPGNINWDVWCGPGPLREYSPDIHPFKWRGWLDYGCGAIGDMGCHTWDAPFNAMEPDYPTQVELLEVEGVAKGVFPSKAHFMWTFPAKGKRPGYKAHWYSGDMKIKSLPDGAPVPKPSATLYVGTKGFILAQGDYGGTPNIYPESLKKEFKAPAKTVRRASHKPDWLAACKGEKAFDYPLSNFMNGGALTEVLLLGALTERLGQTGAKLDCDAEKREVKTKAYLDIIDREPRKGFKL
jgi:predicted dehydrogenase